MKQIDGMSLRLNVERRVRGGYDDVLFVLRNTIEEIEKFMADPEFNPIAGVTMPVAHGDGTLEIHFAYDDDIEDEPYCSDGRDESGYTDVEADAATLASAGWGTEEDYFYCGGDEE